MNRTPSTDGPQTAHDSPPAIEPPKNWERNDPDLALAGEIERTRASTPAEAADAATDFLDESRCSTDPSGEINVEVAIVERSRSEADANSGADEKPLVTDGGYHHDELELIDPSHIADADKTSDARYTCVLSHGLEQNQRIICSILYDTHTDEYLIAEHYGDEHVEEQLHRSLCRFSLDAVTVAESLSVDDDGFKSVTRCIPPVGEGSLPADLSEFDDGSFSDFEQWVASCPEEVAEYLASTINDDNPGVRVDDISSYSVTICDRKNTGPDYMRYYFH